MNDDQIRDLKKAARLASKGDWYYNPEKAYIPGVNGAEPVLTPQEGVFVGESSTIAITGTADDRQSMRDAYYISMAQPKNVLALIDELGDWKQGSDVEAAEADRLRDVVKEQRALLKKMEWAVSHEEDFVHYTCLICGRGKRVEWGITPNMTGVHTRDCELKLALERQ
jgi:hypothetical protein